MRRFAPPLVFHLRPNLWDLAAAPLVFGALVLMVLVARQVHAPIEILEASPISLDPAELPTYALRTTARMFAALAASLAFTFTIGTFAAKSRRAGMILVPLLDVLQSVPILGYISFTVAFFLALFPGSVLGAELAAIFAIFTSQAWNMTFSLYQSLRTVPDDLREVAITFHLSAWQRFWRLEVPFAMPGLLWNMMMSMSGAWFFVVASEAITVGDRTIILPGIGSFVATAISARNLAAIGYAILAMLVVIALYDWLMFRPLVAWSDKFRLDESAGSEAPESRILNLFRRTRFFRALGAPVARMARAALAMRVELRPWQPVARIRIPSMAVDIAWYGIVVGLALWSAWLVFSFVRTEVDASEVVRAVGLGAITLLRVVVLIALALAVWVPLGVLIGLRPKLAQRIQPIAQFLAAFPANLLFPIAVVTIVRFGLNADVWLSPLIILGTQWYILFNVIAGASALPNDLRDVARNLHLRGWLWWKRAMLPGILPYAVTGAITASGGAWNASIVAEAVAWGDVQLAAHGLGAYIAESTAAGDYPRIVLGVAVMCAFVLFLNRTVWRPLYDAAERRFRLG
jgi:NitT/TauT family transport system permease protein